MGEMKNQVVFHSTLWLKFFQNPGYAVLDVVNALTASPQRANASSEPHFPRFVGKTVFLCCLSRLAFWPGLFLSRQCTHPTLTEKAEDSTGVTDGGFCVGCEQNIALCYSQLQPDHPNSLTLKQSKQEQSSRAMGNLSLCENRGMALKGVALQVWDNHQYKQLILRAYSLCKKCLTYYCQDLIDMVSILKELLKTKDGTHKTL